MAEVRHGFVDGALVDHGPLHARVHATHPGARVQAEARLRAHAVVLLETHALLKVVSARPQKRRGHLIKMSQGLNARARAGSVGKASSFVCKRCEASRQGSCRRYSLPRGLFEAGEHGSHHDARGAHGQSLDGAPRVGDTAVGDHRHAVAGAQQGWRSGYYSTWFLQGPSIIRNFILRDSKNTICILYHVRAWYICIHSARTATSTTA